MTKSACSRSSSRLSSKLDTSLCSSWGKENGKWLIAASLLSSSMFYVVFTSELAWSSEYDFQVRQNVIFSGILDCDLVPVVAKALQLFFYFQPVLYRFYEL